MNATRRAFEWLLWRSGFLTLFAVVASLIGSLAMFYVASVDALRVGGEIFDYGAKHLEEAERTTLRSEIVAGVAGFVDGYLFAIVLIIFAVGIYELFIHDIEPAGENSTLQRVLYVKDLDDLEGRLAKVIVLILIVRYFEYALHSEVATSLDMLYLSAGIGLIAISLWLIKPKAG